MLRETALRHFWLMFIVITFANAAVWWRRSRREIANNPALEQGYRRLIRRFLIIMNIPWLILGAQLELPTPPLSSLRFITVFAAVIVIYWIAGFYWLFLAGGAEDLATHPGILRGDPRNPTSIKVQYAVIIGLGITILAALLASGLFPWHLLEHLF